LSADRLVEVEPASWDDVLDDFGLEDVYLRRQYVEGACLLDGGRPAFLHADGPDGGVVFAAVIREITGTDLVDVTTPYGYGGPVGAGGAPPSERFWELYDGWATERGAVTSFIRFHPLYANHRVAGVQIRLQQLTGTIAWQLQDRDLFARLHRSTRNKCRKAERAGVSVAVEPEPERLDEFVSLYEQTMRRQDAAAFYFFPAEYWHALTVGLRDRLILVDARLGGAMVASALCLRGAGWLHYHLSATTDEARRVGASNLLLYEAGSWAAEQGYELFHLGGGVGGREDSLHVFKRGFDPDAPLRECWIGKAIHDQAAYRELAGGEAGFDAYFPAYRVPGALSQTAGTPNRR
jgi:Acetyltransferase (GNAT) domain